nr:probable E3 ubiquitin-protein ligase HECTD4 isoform X2 [Danio rerio]|eukprot:XP_021324858.1 probable E3 ubiquitin-protein ligase HECTD4 isoform X2 [Danio rerio]
MAISRGLHQGKNSLLELTKQICCFLQSAPEQFTLEKIPITESKVSMDVNFSCSSPAKRVNSAAAKNTQGHTHTRLPTLKWTQKS